MSPPLLRFSLENHKSIQKNLNKYSFFHIKKKYINNIGNQSVKLGLLERFEKFYPTNLFFMMPSLTYQDNYSAVSYKWPCKYNCTVWNLNCWSYHFYLTFITIGINQFYLTVTAISMHRNVFINILLTAIIGCLFKGIIHCNNLNSTC